mmetsp:Transcript_104016/g.233524  ORF Transcript_104016/g.233524 Transcript_104016/m.233524 type:complete len:81 (-) Transcript_104016:171-413(-)
MNPGHRFLANLFGDKLRTSVKEFLLSSPAFHRFARESSAKAQEMADEVARAAQPHMEKAAQRSQEAMRQLERQASQMGKK